MTRFAAALLLALGLAVGVAWAEDSAQADRCFPWQELRGGLCVAKSAPVASAPVPAVQEPGPPPVPTETITAPPPLACPPNSHVEGGVCIIDAAPPPTPPPVLIIITCNEHTASGGRCLCPAGFHLVPTGIDPVGTCVRPHADNCLGGQMTVAGQCLCLGQVTMSGQVYDLEFAHGKCVPKRCPRDGPCATAVSTPSVDASSKSSLEERLPARHRSRWADPNTYFRYPGPMHY